ncbi:MAG: hypothetical protein AAF214_01170 [Pseudomonadota bacterium]
METHLTAPDAAHNVTAKGAQKRAARRQFCHAQLAASRRFGEIA